MQTIAEAKAKDAWELKACAKERAAAARSRSRPCRRAGTACRTYQPFPPLRDGGIGAVIAAPTRRNPARTSWPNALQLWQLH